ncbi:MAG TPA: hypothetical protein VIR45_09115 [Kiloniellaceae bacterium]
MTDRLAPNHLDRAELISLLETLGSASDEEVLAAARVLDAKVTAAGTSWSVLLAAGIGASADDAEEPVSDGGLSGGPAAGDAPGDVATRNAESLTLIARLLARGGHSEELRNELEGYKEDIAEGEFTAADHQYLRALYKRLTG